MQYGKKERTLQNFRKEHLCKFMKTAQIIDRKLILDIRTAI